MRRASSTATSTASTPSSERGPRRAVGRSRPPSSSTPDDRQARLDQRDTLAGRRDDRRARRVHAGRRTRSAPALPVESAVECSGLERRLDVVEPFATVARSRTSRPAASRRALAASRSSKQAHDHDAGLDEARHRRRRADAGRPAASGGASMKCSPCSDTASSSAGPAEVRPRRSRARPSARRSRRRHSSRRRRRSGAGTARAARDCRRASGAAASAAPRARAPRSACPRSMRRSSSRAATPASCTRASACCSACLRSSPTALNASTRIAASSRPADSERQRALRATVGPAASRRRLVQPDRCSNMRHPLNPSAGPPATRRAS